MPQMMPIYWFFIFFMVNLFVYFFMSFYFYNFLVFSKFSSGSTSSGGVKVVEFLK